MAIVIRLLTFCKILLGGTNLIHKVHHRPIEWDNKEFKRPADSAKSCSLTPSMRFFDK